MGRARSTLRAARLLVQMTFLEFGRDKGPTLAAALSYYALFAIGPLVVVGVGIAGLVFGTSAARAAMLGSAQQLLGASGRQAVASLADAAARRSVGPFGTIVGAAALLLGAAGVFGQLKLALDTIWEIDRKPRRGFRERTWGAVRDNVLSFAGVAGAGFLLLVSLVLNAVIASIAERLPVAGVAALVLDALLALAVVVAVFASTFKFLPDARLAWRDALVGGAVTAVLFLLGQVAIGLFLGRAGFASSYGSSGAILALLVWVYYSSLILFFGAELTQVYANRFGAHVRPDRHGRAIQEAMREEHELPDVEGTEPLPKRAPRGRRRPE